VISGGFWSLMFENETSASGGRSDRMVLGAFKDTRHARDG